MTTRILVLGGGYVGVWAARRALRAIRRGADATVTLVSATTTHAFHGWTAEVLTGHVRGDRARVPLAGLLPGANLVHGTVASVDLDAKTVAVMADDGVRTLSYDQVVLGVGSRDAHDRVPGLFEHGWSLKDDGGLAALDAHLASAVERAAEDAHARERLLTVVVAGGGFAGVEASAAIAQRLRRSIGAEPALHGAEPRVILLASGAQTLPGLRPRFRRVADYATAQAARAGVEVRTGERLAEVADAGARLSSGEVVPSATVISTIGQAPVILPGTEGLERAADGRLAADRFLRLAPGVWGGGDAVAVPQRSGDGACPTNALWAIFHGRRIGANLVRALRGRAPKPFRFPGLGQGASLGVGRGAAELYGIQLTGWPAWIARWAFFHWFMPSRRVALVTAMEWLRRPQPRRVEPERAPVRAAVAA